MARDESVSNCRPNESEFAMKKSALLASILVTTASLWPFSNANAQDTIVTGPNGLSINCSDFAEQADGSWVSGPNATLTYPNRPGSFANNSFGLHGFNINGVDIAQFLDSSCPR
jgi:hypothetical protein